MLNTICGIFNMRIFNLKKRLFLGKAFFVLTLFFVFNNLKAQNEVFLKMESSTLDEGKKVIIKSDIIFLLETQRMISHFTYPKEYYITNNGFGEAQMYEPATNSLLIQYGDHLKASSSLIYSFLSNDVSDLGLSKMGFQLSSSYYENQFLVTKWIPPSNALSYLSEVKLVFEENNLPVYCEYVNAEEVIDTKIYFSDYQIISNSSFPKRVTTIKFQGEMGQDSTINRVLFSNFTVENQDFAKLKQFKIPEDATLVD